MPEKLEQRLLLELKRKPGQKATELARAIGVDRREVNRCLSNVLAGLVQQDRSYRWRLRKRTSEIAAVTTNGRASSELERLCRYYLECIGQDSDEGVSAFAASLYGEPDYAELPSLPMLYPESDWWNAAGAGRIQHHWNPDKCKPVSQNPDRSRIPSRGDSHQVAG